MTALRASLVDRDHAVERESAAARDARLELDRLRDAINTPELEEFARGVVAWGSHQRARWRHDDAKKEPQDWFWLLGYLAGKALHAHVSGDGKKALHHTISSAAALANWHAAILRERKAGQWANKETP